MLLARREVMGLPNAPSEALATNPVGAVGLLQVLDVLASDPRRNHRLEAREA